MNSVEVVTVVPVLFAAFDGELMGVIILGLVLTLGGFLMCQRMAVLYYCAARDVPPPVLLLRFVCKLGVIFFGLCLLGAIVGR